MNCQNGQIRLKNKEEFEFPTQSVDGIVTKRGENRSEYSIIHKYYPMKLLISSGADTLLNDTDSWQHVENLIQRYFDDLENGVHIWTSFDLASAVIVDSSIKGKEKWSKRTIFYAIGQFSRFIKKNSRRIQVTCSSKTLRVIGFQRADKLIVLIVYNSTDLNIHANVIDGELKLAITVPKKTIQTIVYAVPKTK